VNAVLVATIASPVVTLVGAAVVALIAARSTSKTARYQSDQTTATELARQLMLERAQLLDRVDRNLTAVKGQVTNGGSNLAENVANSSAAIAAISDDLRLVRENVLGLGEDVRGLRDDLLELQRRVDNEDK